LEFPLKNFFRRGAEVGIVSAVVGVAAVAAAIAPSPAAAAGTTAASAASVNQWHLANVWGSAQGQFYAVASSGPADAWAVGLTGSPERPTGPIAGNWNGRAWHSVVVPGSKGLFFDVVEESSAKNVWVIGESTKPGVASTAFIFDGRHWHSNKLPVDGVHQLIVFGPSDAWVATDTGCSSFGCTQTIYHWDGSTWQYRPLTTFLYALTGTSDSNLWAVGLAGSGTGNVTAYRWSGTQWVTRAIPHVQGAAFLGAAASSSDVWISSVTTNFQHTFALHGTAKGWKQVTAPNSVFASAVPVPDGRGGVWLGSQAYWTGSTWLSEQLPDAYTEGWTGINAAFVRAPGTRSYWSAGFTQVSRTTTRPAVSVFGPLP
jgi:hypothetical protein